MIPRLSHRDRAGRVLLWAIVATMALLYAVTVTLPMWIGHRPVSPAIHLVGTFGVGRGGALRYTIIVAVLWCLYATAVYLLAARRVSVSRRGAFATGALLLLIVVPTHPLTSTDIFNYIALGRVQWIHHANPLTTAPDRFPQDPLYGLVANWRELPSPYGPGWSLLAWLPIRLGGDSALRAVLAYKLLAVGTLLAAAWAAGNAAERLRPGAGGVAVALLLWNPMVVWHVAGNGHNDAVMALPLALAVWFAVSGRIGPAIVAFTAAVLIKYAPLLVAPAALIWLAHAGRLRQRGVLVGAAAAALLIVACFAPYYAGRDTLRSFLNEGSYFTVSTPAAVRGALVHVLSVEQAEALTQWLCRGLLFLFLVLAYRRLNWKLPRNLPAAAALTLLVYLTLAAPYFAPWYLLWPLVLAVAVWWQGWLLLPLLGMSAGSMTILVWATWARVRWGPVGPGDWYPMHLLSAAALWAGVLAGFALWRLSGFPTASADSPSPRHPNN